jgi:hypothetical protein
MKTSKFLLTPLLLAAFVEAAPRSAIITLSLPSGARQMGMGETGMAISEDAFATSWNPAALALAPLADEWVLSLPTPPQGPVNALTSFAPQGFLSNSEVWAAANNSLLQWRDGGWRSDHEILLDGNKTLRGALRQFVGSDENLDDLVQEVLKYNRIEGKIANDWVGKLKLPWSLVIKDSITVLHYEAKGERLWVGTPKGLLRFDGAGWKNFGKEDIGQRAILAIASQGSAVWIGTEDGLYRWSREGWQRKGTLFAKMGTPKEAPAPLATPSATGTTDSSQTLGTTSVTPDSNAVQAPSPAPTAAESKPGSQRFTAVAWSESLQQLYVAIDGLGVARLKPAASSQSKDSWNLYAKEDSLLSLTAHSISVDPKGNVWVGHEYGISRFNQNKWDQIVFEGNQLTAMSSSPDGALWFGTKQGIWRFTPTYEVGKEITQADTGTSKEILGKWEHFHRGTGMIDAKVNQLTSPGDEIWASTGSGVEHLRKAKRQFGLFYENLLPTLQIPDLYHANAALTYPLQDLGTLGAFINFVSFGETTIPNDNETDLTNAPKYNSKELVAGLSYGLKITHNHALGVNGKFIYSDLLSGVPGKKDLQTSSYAFDLSYMGRNLLPGLHLGLGLFNMGPDVYYVEDSKVDPIPLTWRMGLAWEAIRKPKHRLIFAGDYNRETLSETDDAIDPFYVAAFKGWSEGGLTRAMWNAGTEYTWNQLIAFRSGYMFDRPGQREEISAGVGVLLSDMMQADVGVIVYDMMGTDVREGQTRFSLLVKF